MFLYHSCWGPLHKRLTRAGVRLTQSTRVALGEQAWFLVPCVRIALSRVLDTFALL